MSDNIRTALYDADYSCTLANRALRRRRRCSARVVGKHCEAGDIVVKDEFLPGDVAPGDLWRCPGTGRLLPLDGQQLQPRACGRRWSRCADGESRVVVRRETEDDLLATRRRLTEADSGARGPPASDTVTRTHRCEMAR